MVIELTEAEAAYLREYRVKDSAHWNKAQMAAEEAEETKKKEEEQDGDRQNYARLGALLCQSRATHHSAA